MTPQQVFKHKLQSGICSHKIQTGRSDWLTSASNHYLRSNSEKESTQGTALKKMCIHCTNMQLGMEYFYYNKKSFWLKWATASGYIKQRNS